MGSGVQVGGSGVEVGVGVKVGDEVADGEADGVPVGEGSIVLVPVGHAVAVGRGVTVWIS